MTVISYRLSMPLKILSRVNPKRLALFALVGTLGFITELCTLLSLIVFAQMSPILAKLIAFSAAVSVTWFFNRHITFSESRKTRLRSELLKYFQTVVGGMCLNLLVFFSVVTLNQNSIVVIVVATALGALVGLLANYYGCVHFVFSTKQDR